MPRRGTNPLLSAQHRIQGRMIQQTCFIMEYDDLSILFSFGKPYGVEVGQTAYARYSKNNYTQKHINAWVDFRAVKRVDDEEFFGILMDAMARTSAELLVEFKNQPGV